MLPVFVINLDRRPDRWAAMSAQLDRLGIEAVRIPAVDARLLAAQEEWERTTNGNPPFWRINLGSAANMLGHGRAMNELLGSDAPAALILEDDAEPAEDLPSFLDSVDWWPERFGLVKFEASGPNEFFFGPECAPPHEGRQIRPIALWTPGSAGYAVNRVAARDILDKCRNVTMPIDHVLFDLRVSRIARTLRPVQILPSLVRQRADEAGSDIEPLKKAMQPTGLARRWHRLRWHSLAIPRKAVVKSQAAFGRTEKVRLEFADTHPS